MPVSRYVALRTVKHSGVDFPPGSPMALSDAYAAPLLAVQAIEPQAGALPAMPAVVGDVVRDSIDTASGSPAEVAIKARMSDGVVEIPAGGVAVSSVHRMPDGFAWPESLPKISAIRHGDHFTSSISPGRPDGLRPLHPNDVCGRRGRC